MKEPIWVRRQVPRNFWKNRANRRRYMQWLGAKLGFGKLEDWYKITQKDFYANKGRGLLINHYQGSAVALVMESFPEYEWKEWLFNGSPKNFWKQDADQQSQ